MRIIFFGTPEYVVAIAESLHKTFKLKSSESGVTAVITQKPKPTGREKKLTYSPIDTWAYKKGIDVIYDFNKVPNADLGILAAYGEIIPEYVIKLFKYGILNIHPSLLPKYRGASPVQAALAASDKQTGVTIIKVDAEMDHGPIVAQFREDILDTDTLETLRERLFERSIEVLKNLIPPFIQGRIKLRKQNNDEATFTTLVKKIHGFIEPKYLAACLQGRTLKAKWEIPFIKNYSLSPNPYTLDSFIRALDPWPGAWTLLGLSSSGHAKRLKILKAHLNKPLAISHPPASHTRKRFGQGQSLIIDLVQLEGKSPVSWEEFKRGYPNATFV